MTTVFANPVLNNITAGNATVSQTSTSTTIHQSSQQAIINWQSFNIKSNEKTQFIQPNSHAIALNRINPSEGASQIYGTLTANGKIILVNSAGIHFGPNAMVNVGGIIASTANLSDENFLANKYIFENAGGNVINEGTIIAAKHGLVALIGENVSNSGYIKVHMGTVILATGNKFTFDFNGDQLINFVVNENSKRGGRINHSGTIVANGGNVILSANAASSVLDNTINMSGVVQANSVKKVKGQIVLRSNGNIRVSGKLIASGKHGGHIKVLSSKNIKIKASARINASGLKGGGEILIGGNYQGKGPEINALNTTVEKGAAINADAIQQGNGGRVIVWSDNNTNFHGSISARGGSQSGNGGFVETSGHFLNIDDAQINLSAEKGTTGNWLLDPADLTICSACTTTATNTNGSYTGNSNSNILVSDIVTALNSANITILTTVNGTGGNGDIFVNAGITWNSGNTLTLSAYRNININSGVTIANSNNGSLVLQANNAGAFTTAASGGTVTNNGTININGTGSVDIFYNPTNFSSPIAYTNSGNSALTAYMLISSLGTQTDASSVLSLGALSNPANSALWNKNFALAKNIDGSDTSTWNAGLGFLSIGNTSVTPFIGKFNGQSHTIDNLRINQSSGFSLGFFNYLTNATVKNLGLTNVNFLNSNRPSGGMAGLVGTMTGGLVKQVYVTGNVQGSSAAGIAVIQNGGTITNSYNAASISSSGDSNTMGNSSFAAAGISGFVLGLGNITNSYNTGNITGVLAAYVGGVVGLLGDSSGSGVGGTLDHVYNIGNITGGGGFSPTSQVISSATSVGGVVGELFGNVNFGPNSLIQNSYNLGTVSSYTDGNDTFGGAILGGFVGSMTGGIITSSYNAGDVIAVADNPNTGGYTYFAAGFVGGGGGFETYITDSYNIGSVTGLPGSLTVTLSGFIGHDIGIHLVRSYNSGLVSGTAGNNVGNSNGGKTGFLAYGDPIFGSSFFQDNFWDKNTSGQSVGGSNQGVTGGCFGTTSCGGVNLALKDTYSSWNITNASSGTPSSFTWYIAEGGTRPILVSELFNNNIPAPITNSHQLQLMAANTNGNYTVTGNINLASGATTAADVWGSNDFTTIPTVNSLTIASTGSISTGYNQSINNLTGSGNLNLSSGVNLTLSNNAATLFSGVISGNGTVTKQGSETLTFSNANTYSGSTSINAGTLQLDPGGSLSSSSIVIGPSGTFIVNNDDPASYNGIITGAGNFVKEGLGQFTLSGANNFSGTATVSAGTLEVTNNSTLNNIFVTDGSTFKINNTTLTSSTLNLDGILLGAGSSVFNGNVVLNGDGTISTDSGVNSLTINGAINGAYNLNLAGDTIVLNGAVGNITPLANLISTANLLALNGGSVSTTGTQSYEDIEFGANTILTGSGIVFNGSVIGNNTNLTINDSQTTLFLGSYSGFSSLQTNAFDSDEVVVVPSTSTTSVSTPTTLNIRPILSGAISQVITPFQETPKNIVYITSNETNPRLKTSGMIEYGKCVIAPSSTQITGASGMNNDIIIGASSSPGGC